MDFIIGRRYRCIQDNDWANVGDIGVADQEERIGEWEEGALFDRRLYVETRHFELIPEVGLQEVEPVAVPPAVRARAEGDFQVGDRVVFKEWEEGDQDLLYGYHAHMWEEFDGNTYTINRINGRDVFFEENLDRWTISVDMLLHEGELAPQFEDVAELAVDDRVVATRTGEYQTEGVAGVVTNIHHQMQIYHQGNLNPCVMVKWDIPAKAGANAWWVRVDVLQREAAKQIFMDVFDIPIGEVFVFANVPIGGGYKIGHKRAGKTATRVETGFRHPHEKTVIITKRNQHRLQGAVVRKIPPKKRGPFWEGLVAKKAAVDRKTWPDVIIIKDRGLETETHGGCASHYFGTGRETVMVPPYIEYKGGYGGQPYNKIYPEVGKLKHWQQIVSEEVFDKYVQVLRESGMGNLIDDTFTYDNPEFVLKAEYTRAQDIAKCEHLRAIWLYPHVIEAVGQWYDLGWDADTAIVLGYKMYDCVNSRVVFFGEFMQGECAAFRKGEWQKQVIQGYGLSRLLSKNSTKELPHTHKDLDEVIELIGGSKR